VIYNIINASLLTLNQ